MAPRLDTHVSGRSKLANSRQGLRNPCSSMRSVPRQSSRLHVCKSWSKSTHPLGQLWELDVPGVLHGTREQLIVVLLMLSDSSKPHSVVRGFLDGGVAAFNRMLSFVDAVACPGLGAPPGARTSSKSAIRSSSPSPTSENSSTCAALPSCAIVSDEAWMSIFESYIDGAWLSGGAPASRFHLFSMIPIKTSKELTRFPFMRGDCTPGIGGFLLCLDHILLSFLERRVCFLQRIHRLLARNYRLS